MILIADSGGTKTDWLEVKSGKINSRVKSSGLHPYFLSTEEMIDILYKEVDPLINSPNIEQVFFYGAGCWLSEKKDIVAQALEEIFTNADIEVESDLLGASRALFQKESGIACILGTGSSSCYYDGKNILNRAPSLGYLLGDEGSGAHVGKQLCKLYLEKQMNPELEDVFKIKYQNKLSNLLHNIYQNAYPNRLLAEFAIFCYENLNHPQIQDILQKSFKTFINNQFNYYSSEENLPFGFCGSMAFYFKDLLQEITEANQINIVNILQSPMEGLMRFHIESL